MLRERWRFRVAPNSRHMTVMPAVWPGLVGAPAAVPPLIAASRLHYPTIARAAEAALLQVGTVPMDNRVHCPC